MGPSCSEVMKTLEPLIESIRPLVDHPLCSNPPGGSFSASFTCSDAIEIVLGLPTFADAAEDAKFESGVEIRRAMYRVSSCFLRAEAVDKVDSQSKAGLAELFLSMTSRAAAASGLAKLQRNRKRTCTAAIPQLLDHHPTTPGTEESSHPTATSQTEP